MATKINIDQMEQVVLLGTSAGPWESRVCVTPWLILSKLRTKILMLAVLPTLEILYLQLVKTVILRSKLLLV